MVGIELSSGARPMVVCELQWICTDTLPLQDIGKSGIKMQNVHVSGINSCFPSAYERFQQQGRHARRGGPEEGDPVHPGGAQFIGGCSPRSNSPRYPLATLTEPLMP